MQKSCYASLLFLYYANEESDDIIIVPQKDEALNHEYLLEYLSRVLQTWHH